MDRWILVFFSGGPLLYIPLHSWKLMLYGSFDGDIWDGYWYNNSSTIGQQIYPQGLYKYFDMSSTRGLWKFTVHWLIDVLWICVSPLTLFIPWNMWNAFFKMDTANFILIFSMFYVPWGIINPLMGMLLSVPAEDGFGMLYAWEIPLNMLALAVSLSECGSEIARN